MATHEGAKSYEIGHELDRLPLNGSHNGNNRKVGSEKQKSTLMAWKWELAMSLLSACAIIALVIVLAVEDGNEYRKWGPLTLNAVNTILTTVAGSALTAFVGSALSQNMWNAFAQRHNGKGAFVSRPAGDLRAFDNASRGPMGSLILLTNRRVG